MINTSAPELLPPGIPGPLPGRLLGIDAGGSATRAVLVTGGQVARRWTAPPMNGLLTDAFTDLLVDIITPAGAPGIAVFAGTGSGASGSDGRRWVRAGGHGFLLGDEGSAYWIGRSAVNAALRWEDGMGGSAALHDAVMATAGSDLADLVAEIHFHPADRGLLSRFAPAVTALAAHDETARRIVRDAAGHLADLARAIQRVLGPLPVSGMGGVLTAPATWEAFTGLIGAVRPLAPPDVGAALLAGAPQAAFAQQPGTMLAGPVAGGGRA